jgi:hypothetical protein
VTAAALRAGVPSVIYPLFMGQPFWASRVRIFAPLFPPPRSQLADTCGFINDLPDAQAATLGVGPPQVIPLKELSRTNLQSQIMSVSDEGAQTVCDARVCCVCAVG